MRSPEIGLDMIHRLSLEEMRARMKPCPWCGAIEREVTPGVFKNPEHDYSKHPGPFARANQQS